MIETEFIIALSLLAIVMLAIIITAVVMAVKFYIEDGKQMYEFLNKYKHDPQVRSFILREFKNDKRIVLDEN